jgi:hypothetical protein
MAAILLGSTREKLRAFLVTWFVIWVSWPLAMLEAILVPDFSVLKRHVLKRKKASQTIEV